jgi:nucleoside-diphosphate-sugar epimerase
MDILDRIILFGGSGFIGTHLSNRLVENQHTVLNFDINNPFEFSQEENHSFVDVRDNIKKSISNPADVIVNLAAVHKTPGHPSNEYFETNILGAQNVCGFARENNINTIVFTSSIAVYGTYEEQKSEATLPMPDIPYGISKLNAEYIHKLWQKEDPANRRLIIIRPGVVFGKYENGNFTRLINSLSKGYFFFPGRKDTRKGCIYVKDLVDLMINRTSEAKAGIEIINASYHPSPELSKIVKTIKQLTKSKSHTITLPSKLLFLASWVLHRGFGLKSFHSNRIKKLMIANDINGEKMMSLIQPKYGLELGLKDWLEETNYSQNKKVY